MEEHQVGSSLPACPMQGCCGEGPKGALVSALADFCRGYIPCQADGVS